MIFWSDDIERCEEWKEPKMHICENEQENKSEIKSLNKILDPNEVFHFKTRQLAFIISYRTWKNDCTSTNDSTLNIYSHFKFKNCHFI